MKKITTTFIASLTIGSCFAGNTVTTLENPIFPNTGKQISIKSSRDGICKAMNFERAIKNQVTYSKRVKSIFKKTAILSKNGEFIDTRLGRFVSTITCENKDISPAQKDIIQLCESGINEYGHTQEGVINCINNGVSALEVSKLEVFKNTCATLPKHPVGLNLMRNCRNLILDMDMAGSDDFDHALRKCRSLSDEIQPYSNEYVLEEAEKVINMCIKVMF